MKTTNCGTDAVGRLPGAVVEGQTQGVPLVEGVDGQVHWYQLGSEPAAAGEWWGVCQVAGWEGGPELVRQVKQLAPELLGGGGGGGGPAPLPLACACQQRG